MDGLSRLKRAVYPMPEDVKRRLEKEGLMDAYLLRPPYQRNDYIGWMQRARLPATREKRLCQMLRELQAGDAYMGMAWRKK